MKRKLYFHKKQLIQTNSNNNIKQPRKYLSYKNNIAKVYEVNTHGKFTIIIRRSFIQLPIHSTTNMNPCYSYDLLSRCDSKLFLQSNLNNNHYLVRNRKGKTWRSMYEKSNTETESSTFIVHRSTTQHQNDHKKYSSCNFYIVY
ncbi:unnamed protein product [Adineta steineri]|uniref:Uncharacterized protein n=1 Tax=Adineta steineri TaxID=433720 RepID=A0A815FKD4_9BILA|nr:unnamed protein product [Adineta steineri]CAF1331935.1 unnamed protein product [Adineta steineri]